MNQFIDTITQVAHDGAELGSSVIGLAICVTHWRRSRASRIQGRNADKESPKIEVRTSILDLGED